MDIINEYIIEGEVSKIKITRKNGEILYALIDTKNINLVEATRSKVFVGWNSHINGYYACITKYLGMINKKPKYETLRLHRIIMNAKKGDVVDHINQKETLDNRESNLRITVTKDNLKHRKSKNSNNTSGYRNVSKIGKWWCVQMQINGKNTMLKKFPLDQLEEAGRYAQEMRTIYYGEFSGAS